ncbi:MAG: hypothetical protein E7256_03945 [Lachnospiraceae bacterium]|nr:hypothetical protein [Lachnospiraceae bacterium]
MKYIGAVILTMGLSSDVFIASISKGLAIRKLTGKKLFGISFVFAVVQGGFAILSYQLSEGTGWIFEWLDHWISFIFLLTIGNIMLIRSYHNEELDQKEPDIRYFTVLLIGIAVGNDVLAISTTDTFSQINQWIGMGIIWTETFLIASLGIIIGHNLGIKYRYKSEFAGGIILIALAVKILLFGLGRK